MVKLMIESVDQDPAPKRFVLGSDSDTMMREALTERLAGIEAQKETAFSTDFLKQG